LVTGALILIGIFVIISIVWLFVYWFGGGNPLTWNTVARVEAAQNPANVLNSWYEYQNRRRSGCLVGIVFVVGVLVVLAPSEAAALAEAMVSLGMRVISALIEALQVFVDQMRS
jgi:hypothetical protein